jgi:putative colanic acid biosynthesis acetyltransferase WcaF
MIGSEAWICADAFVGPGVTIGEGAIVAARAVTVKDVRPWSIVIGNPAREIKRREIPQ